MATPAGPARPFEIVGFAGSLRQGSFNRALLRAAVAVSPPTLRVAVHDLAAVPLYNGDVEARGVPEAVRERRRERTRCPAAAG